MVSGAVNDLRLRILLDTGVTGSMISLDLARRLKLKTRVLPEPIKVTGLGGAPSYITSSARVKITLGWRVVYILDVWLANIGEDIEVLLGMNFMYAAGVRLCVREGLVKLPDEENIIMRSDDGRHRQTVDQPVCPRQTLYLMPGEHAIVRIKYGQANPQREVVWAGRGDRWVTQIIYAARSWASAVKVINISTKMLWIDSRTAVARIVEYQCFPEGRFVRPGKQKYKEWQQLIYECTSSSEFRERQRRHDALEEAREPPLTENPAYPWPSEMLLRPHPGTQETRVTKLQARPERAVFGVQERSVPATVDEGVQTNKMTDVATQTDPLQEVSTEMVVAMSITAGAIGDVGETIVMEQLGGELPEPDGDDVLDEDDSADLSNQAMPGTPV
jgi:hypothetical protein